MNQRKLGKLGGMCVVVMFMMTGILAAMPTVRAEEDGEYSVAAPSALSYIGPTVIETTYTTDVAVLPMKPATILIGSNEYVWTDYRITINAQDPPDGGLLTIRVLNKNLVEVAHWSRAFGALFTKTYTGTAILSIPRPPYQEGATPTYIYIVTWTPYAGDSLPPLPTLGISAGAIGFVETRTINA